MIAPYDQAVSHEETIVMRTEADVEEQAKALHRLQRVRDAKLEESAAGSDRKKKSSSRRQSLSA